MERDKANKISANVLSERGMTVKICPLGTGIVVHQSAKDSKEFTAHLTLLEARELAAALVVAAHNARIAMMGCPKSITSLYAQGLRIDQIAAELNLTIKEVRDELIARGLLKDPEED